MNSCSAIYIYMYSWSKSSLGFFCKILWTNPNELFGQPCIYTHRGFPGGSVVKNSLANAGDTGLIPESERSPGEGNDNPLQCSCLETPRDRGAWWTTVDMVSKSPTQLKWPSMHARTLLDNVILDLRTSPSGKKIFLEWFKEPMYLGWWAFLGGKSCTQHLTPTSAFQSCFLERLNQAFWVCLWHSYETWDGVHLLMKASSWTHLWTLGAVKAWSKQELTTIMMDEMRRILLESFHVLDIEKSRRREQVMQKSLQPWGNGLAQNRSALTCNSLQAGTWSFRDPNQSRICICFFLCLHIFQGLPRDPPLFLFM